MLTELENKYRSGVRVSPMLLASIATALGNDQKAQSFFEDALKRRNDFMLYLDSAPEYKEHRGKDWFKELVQKVAANRGSN